MIRKSEFFDLLRSFEARLNAHVVDIPGGPPVFGFTLSYHPSSSDVMWQEARIGRVFWRRGKIFYAPPIVGADPLKLRMDDFFAWVSQSWGLHILERPRRIYLSKNDPRGVTPSQLKRLGIIAQAEYLEHWLRTSGTIEVPILAEDGAPLLIDDGRPLVMEGPSVRDRLHAEFGRILDPSRIDEIAAAIQEDRRPRARRGKRYYTDEDWQIGATPSQLKRMGRDRPVEYMAAWFRGRFEDPANGLPYNSQEGGYQWIRGGPYDARDQLEGEFGSLASDEAIELAVDEVQRDGIYDWAPGPRHPDMAGAGEDLDGEPDDEDREEALRRAVVALEAGLELRFDDDEETTRRQDLLTSLARLRDILPPATKHGGIGHNNPPPDEEVVPPTILQELHSTLEAISAELIKARPAALVVARAAWEVVKWFGRKGDKAADAFAGTVGKNAGLLVVAAMKPEIVDAAAAFGASALRWLTHLMGG